MKAALPAPDPETLSAAFCLVFRQGWSPPSCPAPNDTDLLNRILDAVPDRSPAVCREALIRVRRLSFDAAEIGSGFCNGEFGEGLNAAAAALAELETRNPGFSGAEYRTAFSVGRIRAGL
jgi:hypothetical protein